MSDSNLARAPSEAAPPAPAVETPDDQIQIMLDGKISRLDRSVEALDQWLKKHPAPEVKPEGNKNSSELAFLITLRKDARAFGHPGKGRNAPPEVFAVHGAQMDLDKGDLGKLRSTAKALEASGYGSLFWLSHSATEESPAGRLILLYDSPCPPEAHERIYPLLVEQLAPWAPKMNSQRNYNRGWNRPRASAKVAVRPGALVNWRALLERAPELPKAAARAGTGGRTGDGADWSAPLATNEERGRAAVLACPPAVSGEGGQAALMKAIATARIWGLSYDQALDALREWDAAENAPDDSWFAPEFEAELARKMNESSAVHGERALEVQDAAGFDPTAAADEQGAGDRIDPRKLHTRDAIPAALMKKDFDDADTTEQIVAIVTKRQNWWKAYLKARHCVLLNQGGRCVVTWWMPSEIDPKAAILTFQSQEQFGKAWANYQDVVSIKWERDKEAKKSTPTPEYMNVAKWWLFQRDRHEAISAVFRPDVDARMVEGHLNTWTGFGVEPRAPGPTVQAFLTFVKEVIASGNQIHADYILNRLAWIIQNRGQRSGVALVLRGKKGTGKNTFLDAVRDVWGTHGMTVTRPEHVTGKFNAHLADKCYLLANEAIPPADKVAESALKGLITDPTLPIERKGIDTVDGPNYLNVDMATNEEWAVPATPGERRFAVFDVSSAKKDDAAYWTRIHGLRDQGLLGELLGWALSVRLPPGWHPRAHIPQTSALADQIFRGLRGEARAVGTMLAAGEASGALKWSAGRVFISTRLFVDALGKGPEFEAAYGRELAKCCGEGATSERFRVGGIRHRGYWLPALDVARVNWAKAVGFTGAEWPTVDGWLNPNEDLPQPDGA